MRQSKKQPKHSSLSDHQPSQVSYPGTQPQSFPSSGQAISVVLRIRPLSQQQLSRNDQQCFKQVDQRNCQLVHKTTSKNFRFNSILYDKATQQNVYDTDYLNSALDGYAVTVFAYGQTGSGKTYTMAGHQPNLSSTTSTIPSTHKSSDNNDGIIPRSIRTLSPLIHKRSPSQSYSIKASFCQIYNQQIKDLLNPTSGVLHCRWNSANGFFVENLLVVNCESVEDVLEVLNEGVKNRRIGSHELNKDSSRSHSILTIYLISSENGGGGGGGGGGNESVRRYGKISFVDLAGSERLKESKSEGVMAKQTGNINKSLFTLGKVIKQLSLPNKSKNPYIPYRDSKLTMLLMDSLGGSSKSLMIACVSPSSLYLDQTLSTLNYATRTMNIKNKPAIQMNQKDQLIFSLMKERGLLRMENQYLMEQIDRVNKGIKVQPMVIGEKDKGKKGQVDLPPISNGKSIPKPSPLKPNQKPQSQKAFYPSSDNPSIDLTRIANQYQFQLSRLSLQNKQLKNLLQLSDKNYHNTHNDNYALQLKLDNLENLFIKNGTTKGGNIQQQYMNQNMAAENRVLREKIGKVEEEMFEMQEGGRRREEERRGKGGGREEEVEIRKMKVENRGLMEKVEFMQRREKELMDGLKK